MERNNVTVIKKFFESGKHGRKVKVAELKKMNDFERQELADLCRKVKGS